MFFVFLYHKDTILINYITIDYEEIYIFSFYGVPVGGM